MELTCPACTAPGLTFEGADTFECAYCGTQFVGERTECPACGELNASSVDLCVNCGEPLSIVASVLDRQGKRGEPLWIRRLQSQVASLKESEERASAQRFEIFADIDRRRKGAEAEDHARQQQTDRNILFYGAVGILVLVLVVLILVVLT